MPALANPRHERYAQAFFNGLANGMTQEKAYLAAGYTVNNKTSAARSCASRLMQTIASRVRELQAEQTQRLERKLDLSKERVGRRLSLASDMAERQENPSAIVQSETSIAKVFGHITDKQELVTKQESPQSSHDIASALLNDVGLEQPDSDARDAALAAYDTMIATLEQIRDRSLGLSRSHS